MKKSLVLVVITVLAIGCKKESEIIPNIQNSVKVDTVISTKNSSLVKDEEGITDYVIVNTISTNCETYFLNILKSSKEFKNDTKDLDSIIKKNGGIGLNIKLEKEGQGIKYIVSESYSDKNTVINIYFFNFENTELYKEDYLFGSLEQIDFNHKLLSKINLYCSN